MIQNKYKILDFIGKGNFGSVFLGEKSGEKVAIKLEKKNGISILKNETRILEYLARNGCRTQIPQVFWFGLHTDDDNVVNHCLVMTYFIGKVMMDTKIDINKWMISALEILKKIHDVGVVHRDLKPAHFIFVEEKQKWVLIDFVQKSHKFFGLDYIPTMIML